MFKKQNIAVLPRAQHQADAGAGSRMSCLIEFATVVVDWVSLRGIPTKQPFPIMFIGKVG